tara:strand:- start:633 stop:1199 length:567 start_codon:yes stop_codon:yes gene_type:complete
MLVVILLQGNSTQPFIRSSLPNDFSLKGHLEVMMGRKRKDDKYTPVLNRHLLEGAFAESMSQVLMSLDQCRIHKETDMTIDQHVRALWRITMDETEVPILLTDNRHSKTMVKKQAQFIQRLKSLRSELFKLNPNKKSDLASILRAITHWLQDAHLILHEDTPKDIRDYLASKGASDDEEETREVIGVQ